MQTLLDFSARGPGTRLQIGMALYSSTTNFETAHDRGVPKATTAIYLLGTRTFWLKSVDIKPDSRLESVIMQPLAARPKG